MNSIVVCALLAGLAAGIAPSYRLFETDGMLQPNGQFLHQLPTLQAGKGISVFAEIQGKDGDLNCYLLTKSGSGYRVAAMDEKANSNACFLLYTPTKNEPARLWLRNSGTATVHFNTTVNQ